MKIKIKFEPRDVWLGLYWNKEIWNRYKILGDEERIVGHYSMLRLYICIIPLLPIIIDFKPKEI
jgi:hypothetical protein